LGKRLPCEHNRQKMKRRFAEISKNRKEKIEESNN